MQKKSALQKASKKDFSKRPLEERKAAFNSQISKYQNACPILLELKNNENETVYAKICGPGNLMVAEFKIKINSLFQLSAKDQTSAFVVKKTRVMLNNNALISEVYRVNKNQEDGWLYLMLEPSKPF